MNNPPSLHNVINEVRSPVAVSVIVLLFTLIGCAAGPKPALHQAVLRGDLKSVRSMLNNGADPNVMDDERETPIYQAIYQDRFDIAQELLDHGAKVNWYQPHNDTPLTKAVNRNDVKAAVWLLSHGALDCCKEPDTTQETIAPLHLAALKGDGNMVKTLLKYGCDPRAKDAYSRRPVDMAKGEAVALLQDASGTGK